MQSSQMTNKQTSEPSIKTVSFKTLGCKFNQSETDVLLKEFAKKGYEIRSFGEEVDLTLINTCTVTHIADRDSRNLIRNAKRTSPNAKIIVTGCYAEMSADEIKKIPEVDLILDIKEKYRIFDYLNQTNAPPVLRSLGEGGTTPLSTTHYPRPRTRAFLKVQEGCNYFCSYCIVPFARGGPKSLSHEQILDEAKTLIEQNYLEIVLTGINVGLYNDKGYRLENLVDDLQKIPGLKRLRLSSLEPNTITDGLLKIIAKSDVICPHLHIPLQSGDNATLKSMNRKYTTKEYAAVTKRVKEFLPNAAIGTDVIVGFPGETDEEYENTFAFIKSQPFTYLHVFSFSARQGTAAAKMADKIAPPITKERSQRLRGLERSFKENYYKKFIGKTLPVYFDQTKNGLHLGYTHHYIRVAVESENIKKGDFVDVKITGIDDELKYCLGNL